jgi:hypothetical protein
VDKDEGISDEEDVTELKLQLELNEQVIMFVLLFYNIKIQLTQETIVCALSEEQTVTKV